MTSRWAALSADLRLTEHLESAVHPHVPAERADLFRSRDCESTEFEYLNLLHALILASKPALVLETGSGRGYGTTAIAAGLQFNGFGRLITVDLGHAQDAKDVIERSGLGEYVAFSCSSGLEFLRRWAGPRFDFIFFDSDIHERWQEYEMLRQRDLLSAGGLVAFHDSSALRTGVTSDLNYSKNVRALRHSVHFPLSRGFTIARPSAESLKERRDAPFHVTPVQEEGPVFRHSGARGDIIYSLPLVKAMGGGTFLIDPHPIPAGKPSLGIEAATMMLPLLRCLPYVQEARVYSGETISHDLDRFRGVGETLFSEHLAHSHARALGVTLDSIDLENPWLHVAPSRLADIVICRTGKRPGSLNWRLLKGFENRCVFVGTWNEFIDFKRDFALETAFHYCGDYLELARLVAGAKLVVSDQTFVFALAEGLKVPRVLEVFADAPNCLPQSSNGFTELSEPILERCLRPRSWVDATSVSALG